MKRNAFTLTELLIVVVIIGILATIAYPQFGAIRIRARLKEVPNTVPIIAAAMKYYYIKTNSYYWFSKNGSGDGSGSDSDNRANYANAEAALNIILPKDKDDAICEYYTASEGYIHFRLWGNGVVLGNYNINTGVYSIEDTSYKKYLKYLQ
ncbi:MAG: prepilin-type N-terminal cleavage/methylation domain-containing protein [Candidatus Omnitrophota bacterium]|nr:MAG: prepilin-type N-terminal cleavage/methylation domain-containing protein [Candidatus Omnitrophota bacterium]